MRWERLFEDLEAQLAADEVHDREAEIADRTRRERALIDLHARLLANVGGALGWWVGGQALAARVVEVGPDWALVEPAPGRPAAAARGGALGLGTAARSADLVGRGSTSHAGPRARGDQS